MVSGEVKSFVVLIKAQWNDKKHKDHYLKPPGWSIIEKNKFSRYYLAQLIGYLGIQIIAKNELNLSFSEIISIRGFILLIRTDWKNITDNNNWHNNIWYISYICLWFTWANSMLIRFLYYTNFVIQFYQQQRSWFSEVCDVKVRVNHNPASDFKMSDVSWNLQNAMWRLG